MLRVLGAGLVGGVVLLLWSVVFSAVGPADAIAPRSVRGAERLESLRARVAEAELPLPFGPATAHAAGAGGGAPEGPRAAPASFDPVTVGASLVAACAAATLASMLMAWFGGARRSFAERVLFAVLLGAFAGLAMTIPAGGWTELSLHGAAMYVGEVLVGWTLAGMAIALVLSRRPAKARA